MPIRTAIDVSVYQQQSRVAQVKSVAKLVMPAAVKLSPRQRLSGSVLPSIENKIDAVHLRAQWKREKDS